MSFSCAVLLISVDAISLYYIEQNMKINMQQLQSRTRRTSNSQHNGQADGKLDCDISSYKKHNGSFFHTDALQSNAADVATLIFWNFEIPEAKAKGMEDA